MQQVNKGVGESSEHQNYLFFPRPDSWQEGNLCREPVSSLCHRLAALLISDSDSGLLDFLLSASEVLGTVILADLKSS